MHLNDAFYSVHSLLCSVALIWQLAVYYPHRVAPLISLQFWVVSVSAFSVAAGCLVLALQVSIPVHRSGSLTVSACLFIAADP